MLPFVDVNFAASCEEATTKQSHASFIRIAKVTISNTYHLRSIASSGKEGKSGYTVVRPRDGRQKKRDNCEHFYSGVYVAMLFQPCSFRLCQSDNIRPLIGVGISQHSLVRAKRTGALALR
jgi:hypothetical protein